MASLTRKELLAVLRKRASGSSQAAVAKELGVSKMMISDLLKGRREISDSFAKKLGFDKMFVSKQ